MKGFNFVIGLLLFVGGFIAGNMYSGMKSHSPPKEEEQYVIWNINVLKDTVIIKNDKRRNTERSSKIKM